MDENENLIKSSKDLKNFFFENRKNDDNLEEGIMVSGKIRKKILISYDQGKITLEGRVERIRFENLGGSVYRAFVMKGSGEVV